MSFLKFLNEAKAKSVSFVVDHPLGQSFCDELLKAAKKIGFTAQEDPMMEGQDSCGFFISKDPTLVKKAIKTTKSSLDNGDDEDYYGINDTEGIAAISMDWEDFDPEEVSKNLTKIGIKLTHEEAEDTFLITLRA